MTYGLNSIDYLDENDRELEVTFRVTRLGTNTPDDGPEAEFIRATDSETGQEVELSEEQQDEALAKLLTQTINQNA